MTVSLEYVENRGASCAEACLSECLRGNPLLQAPRPIPVERWIESPLGIELAIQDLGERDGAAVLGLAQSANRRIIIDASLQYDEPRFRFTAAHELGHIWMHHSEEGNPTDVNLASVRHDQQEGEADAFAAAFLMPRILVFREVLAIARDDPGDVGEQVACLARFSETSIELWASRYLPELCARFLVSRSAMLFRLRRSALTTAPRCSSLKR